MLSNSSATSRLTLSTSGQLLLGATAAIDGEQMLVNRNGSCKMTVRAEEDSSARDALFSLHTRNTGAQCRINFVDGAGAGSGAGQIYYNHDGNSMRFLTDATEHFTLLFQSKVFLSSEAEVCGDLAGTKYYGYYSTIFMSQGKYWHHDGNVFIFDPGGDTNNIYILLFFHLFH
mgnify:CR=1 FL=1